MNKEMTITMWISLDTTKTIYPEFFKTELKNPSNEIKHMIADER